MYSSHFRKIAALHPCCSKDKVSLSEHQMPKAEQGMKLSHSNTLFIFFQEEKLTIFCCSWYKTFPFWQKFDQRSSWKSCHLIFLSSASSKTQIYFQHVNVFKMLLTIIMTMVMMTIISAMIIITKYSLPTIYFATRYSTRYSDFLLQPYSNPTRSEKSLLVGACLGDSISYKSSIDKVFLFFSHFSDNTFHRHNLRFYDPADLLQKG